VVGHLVDVGHDVTLAPAQTGGDGAMPEALVGHPRCRVVPAGVTRQDGLKLASGVLRSTRDYLRYHEAPFRGATANRGRALRALVRSVSNGTQELPAEMPDTLLPLNDRSAARLWKALRDLEALIPSDPAFERFIADQSARTCSSSRPWCRWEGVRPSS